MCEIKYKDCNCFLEYINFKDDLIEYKCLWRIKKHYQKNCHENLKNDFLIHTSFLAMISKFILLSRKGVYP